MRFRRSERWEIARSFSVKKFVYLLYVGPLIEEFISYFSKITFSSLFIQSLEEAAKEDFMEHVVVAVIADEKSPPLGIRELVSE